MMKLINKVTFTVFLIITVFFLYFFMIKTKVSILKIENSDFDLEKIVYIKNLDIEDIKNIHIEISGEEADTLSYDVNIEKLREINKKSNILKIPVKYLIAGKISDVLITTTKNNNKIIQSKFRIKTNINKVLRKYIPDIKKIKTNNKNNKLYFFLLYMPLSPSHFNKQVNFYPFLMDCNANIRSFNDKKIINQILKLPNFKENVIDNYHVSKDRIPIVLSKNNYFVSIASNSKGNSVTDCIIIVDINNKKLIKSINLKDVLDKNRLIFKKDKFINQVEEDWLHLNSIAYDYRDNTLILSSRYQGIFKIDLNGNLKWIFSNHEKWNKKYNKYLFKAIDENGKILDGNIQNGNMFYKKKKYEFEWPSGQHCVNIYNENILLMFDNGILRNYTNKKYSRAVMYKIDENNMTVQQIWQYGKELGETFYSEFHGTVYIYDNICFINPASLIYDIDKSAINILKEVDISSKEVLAEFYFDFKNIKEGTSHPWFDNVIDARIVNLQNLENRE